jgi:predicted HTH domain antitoxin
LAKYYNDIAVLEIVQFYTNLVTNLHFDLSTPLKRESMLRALEALVEAISEQLTPETQSLYNGLNIGALSEVRNYLDHINGDLREHRVSSRVGRAVRLEGLIEGRDPATYAAELLDMSLQALHKQLKTKNITLKNWQQILFDSYRNTQAF